MSASGGALDDRSSDRPSPLASALREATRRCLGGADHLTVLYSGGLDSSLAAHLWKAMARVDLLVVGTEGSHDLASARLGAELLGLPLREETIGTDDLRRALARDPTDLGALREPMRSVHVALAAAFERTPGPTVGVGQGADELFYGYAHFRALTPELARRRSQEDLSILLEKEWPRTQRVARSYGLEPVSPYLDAEVAALASMLPPPSYAEPPKIALRRAAAELGVPPAIVAAPKRALQYGSGVHREMRKLDRDTSARSQPIGRP